MRDPLAAGALALGLLDRSPSTREWSADLINSNGGGRDGSGIRRKPEMASTRLGDRRDLVQNAFRGNDVRGVR